MAKIVGNKPIKIIQGQTFDIRRKFSTEVTENIQSVAIVCNELELNINLSKTESGEFTYRMSDSLTASFPAIETTYDMIVTYTDGSIGIQTGIAFSIIARQNPVLEEN